MKTLNSKHISLNNQETKICIPITSASKEEIISEALAIKEMNPDIIEWRADYFIKNEIKNAKTIRLDNPVDQEELSHNCEILFSRIEEILKCIKELFPSMPIIFTIRTTFEGGEIDITDEAYKKLCLIVANMGESYNVDFVDVELYRLSDVEDFMDGLHNTGVKVIGSNHHFDKTPSKDKMVNILKTIEDKKADICKLAVMPKEKADVTALIEASKEADKRLKNPIITMSMSELGAVTRVCTKMTGSVLTFATGINTSAPGQESAEIVRSLLKYNEGCTLCGNIALIGFMGTGKTTVSQALSRITGFEEIDVDRFIVETKGMSINEIFAEYGENGFRDIETEALREIAKENGRIISCGGGAVLRDENVEILKSAGTIVLLTATPQTIFERVKDHTHRPILNDDMSLSHVKELMSKRESRYTEVADVIVSVDSNDRVETCYHLLKQLEELGKIQISKKENIKK